uniref:Amino acid transporter n=1 Tax=Globodera pallida TaxID=36090 RepID=A0A183CIR9_GLOPA
MEGRRHRRTWRNTWRHSMKLCRAHLLLSLTISSVFVGLVLGFALRSFQLSSETVRLVNFPGEIFMQVLKMMILPLIFSSLVSALAQMDARESGQMSLLTVGYYAITTLFATVVILTQPPHFCQFNSAFFKFHTGVLLVLAIHPGDPSIKQDLAYLEVQHPPISPLDTFLDVVRNMFPENVVQASLQRVQTKYFSPKKGTPHKILQQMTQQKHGETAAQNRTVLFYRKKIENVNGINILGEARELVSGIRLKDENYDVVLQLLKDTYGAPEEHIRALHFELANLKACKSLRDTQEFLLLLQCGKNNNAFLNNSFLKNIQ